eukprot:1878816-Alexandrium_andersonii.AAC.1
MARQAFYTQVCGASLPFNGRVRSGMTAFRRACYQQTSRADRAQALFEWARQARESVGTGES